MNVLKFVVVVALMVVAHAVYAQGPPPPPSVPIDGGLTWFAGVAAAYAVKKKMEKSRLKNRQHSG